MSDLDFEQLIEQSINNNYNFEAFDKIDEQQFKEAPNFMDFYCDKEFLGSTPWGKKYF